LCAKVVSFAEQRAVGQNLELPLSEQSSSRDTVFRVSFSIDVAGVDPPALESLRETLAVINGSAEVDAPEAKPVIEIMLDDVPSDDGSADRIVQLTLVVVSSYFMNAAKIRGRGRIGFVAGEVP
jgi:hypothetical protein